MKTYIVFDGRADSDIDEAQILDYIGDNMSLESAVAVFKKHWSDMDARLVSFDVSVNGDLVNPEILQKNNES